MYLTGTGDYSSILYNEFTNEKKLKFIESQLKDSKALGGLTENSRKNFTEAQNYLQKYMVSQDDKDLKLYFESLKKLKGNFDKIGEYESLSPGLKTALLSKKGYPKAFRPESVNGFCIPIFYTTFFKNW